MEEDYDNKLILKTEDGNEVTINVLDIIDSNAYGKTFVIYTVQGADDTVFASILNEGESTYSLETITNENEINYINSEITRFASEDE